MGPRTCHLHHRQIAPHPPLLTYNFNARGPDKATAAACTYPSSSIPSPEKLVFSPTRETFSLGQQYYVYFHSVSHMDDI